VEQSALIQKFHINKKFTGYCSYSIHGGAV
jgi:hypothetical protein